MSIDVSCKYAFMTKSMQRRVEPSDAAEKVHKTHRKNLEAEVIKHNGGTKVELEEIVKRIAELVPIVDSTTNIQVRNRRNKRPYVKGVATLFEPQFTKEVVR